MSEYQYHEFLAIDQPLTAEQQARLRGLSSRARVTPGQAIFTYSYSNLPADPIALLTEHFDIMLYLANWGARRLAFRFPRAAIDAGALRPYDLATDEIELTMTPTHVVVDIDTLEEGGFDWIEGEGVLSPLVPLREEILGGDLRSLYLAWLKSVALQYGINDDAAPDASAGDDADGDAGYEEEDQDEDDDAEDDPASVIEPPVPPGLGQPSPALAAFIAFLDIDADLLTVAAATSPPLVAADEPFDQWATLLPESERLAFLVRLARGEPGIGLELRRRLRTLGAVPSTPGAPDIPRRSVADLLAATLAIRRARQAWERQAAEQARQRHLATVAQREPAIWQETTMWIDQKTSAAYGHAVALLVDLRDLAEHRGERARFAARVEAIRAEYGRRPALMERLRKAGLI